MGRRDMLRKNIGKVCLILAVLTVAAAAQNITGSIAGTVKDPSGAVLPKATVTLTNTDTGVVMRTVKTDASGNYSAPLLPIGHYSVTIEGPGFVKFVQQGIELNVNDKLTVNAQLQVGATGETVVVEANPLQVETQSAAAVGVVTATQIQELSLNTRNYEQLVTLLPGVSSSQTTDQIYVGAFAPIGTNVVTFSINGARTSENNWTIDGFDNVDRGSNLTLLSFPSVDAISEFKVVRGAYDPEFGRSGGAQVNVVTRSGTNRYHGSAYEFFRNDVLTANNFINKRFSDPAKFIPRPPLHYNNFGWTLGGPVSISGVYNKNKDKTFFFFSEEFRRTITYANPSLFVPTSGERTGTFANNVCITFNASGTCTTTGKQIASINPVAQQYIKDIFNAFPVGNDASDPHLFHSTVGSIFNYREEMLKIDHVFGPRLMLSGKYLHDSIPTTEPLGIFNGLSGVTGLPGVNTTSTNSPGHQYSVRFTSALSSTLLLDGGYGYSYGAIVSDITGIATPAGSPDIKVPLLFTSTLGRIPSISFGTATGSPTGIGGTGPYRDFNTNHSVFGGLTKIWGRHTFKTGGTYYRYEKNEKSANRNQGIFTIKT